ncbi:surface lipoprotein assembly modifier [Aliiruegeria sabulilitoris]|uniref:surface lipoprotein assembly modifier n=1 Tax=Aliiruegeria sabulilitoris TaxID=1510458 RepID=UPI0008326229|nr:surface lipoprotein assembly modifier [Aliiruegeria sabulilitoris]
MFTQSIFSTIAGLRSLRISRNPVARGGAFAAAALLLLTGLPAGATPNMVGDCTLCHLSGSNLPQDHVAVDGMNRQKCLSCHVPVDAGLSTPQPTPTPRAQAAIAPQEQLALEGSVAEIAEDQTAFILPARHPAGLPYPPDPFTLTASFGVLSSSNIGMHRSGWIFDGAPIQSTGLCGPPFWRFERDEEHDSQISGNRIHLGLDGKYTRPTSTTDSLILGFGVTRDQFPQEDLGRSNARLSAGWQRRTDSGTMKATAILHRAHYDGDGSDDFTDHTALGFSFNYHHFLPSNQTLSTCLRFRKRQYDDEDAPRQADWSASLAYSRLLPNASRYGLGVALSDRNNPEKDSSRYVGPSIFGVFDKQLGEGLSGRLSAEAGVRRYDAEHEHTGITRDDRVWDIGLELVATRPEFAPAQIRFGCHYTQTNSNIDAEDRNDSYCAALIEARF